MFVFAELRDEIVTQSEPDKTSMFRKRFFWHGDNGFRFLRNITVGKCSWARALWSFRMTMTISLAQTPFGVSLDKQIHTQHAPPISFNFFILKRACKNRTEIRPRRCTFACAADACASYHFPIGCVQFASPSNRCTRRKVNGHKVGMLARLHSSSIV